MKSNESSPILCGTDFSGHAGLAANVAAALARRLNAPLVLVHAESLLLESADQNDYDALTAGKRDSLRDEAARLRRLGVNVEEILSLGAPEDVLARLARDRSARLVVVSSLGLSGAARWLIGSVAERVAESSPVTTLVVRDAALFEAWANGGRALRVFVGMDFSVTSDAALRWAIGLREIGPVEVVAGYADWPPEEASRLGVLAPLGTAGGNTLGIQQTLERDLRDKITRLLGVNDVGIRVRGNWGRADMPLVEMAGEAGADLTVTGTHQRHGIGRLGRGSVSRGILRHAPMSVACVPPPPPGPVAGQRARECKRVLVAVDLDEPDGLAAAHAYAIVNPGGTVLLLHNIAPSFWLTSPAPDQGELARTVAASEAKLLALAPAEAFARCITTEVEVTANPDSAGAICAAAERFNADIICVGSHTRPGLTAKVLGSVSLAVLQTSRRPVLMVWPSAE